MKTLLLAAFLCSVSLGAAAAPPDDRATDARVRAALKTDLGTAARCIHVSSYGGTVELSGSVGSMSLGEGAVRTATNVDGVNHVQDVLIHAPGFAYSRGADCSQRSS